MVLKAIILRVAGGGVWAAIAHGRTVLPAVRESVANEALLFFEEDEENFRVDAAGLGGLVDNFSGSLSGADGRSLAKEFFGKADEVTVVSCARPMPTNGFVGVSLILVELAVGIFTRVFQRKECLDVRNGHASIVSHDGIADNVARVKALYRGGRGVYRVAGGEKGKSSSHEKTKSDKN